MIRFAAAFGLSFALASFCCVVAAYSAEEVTAFHVPWDVNSLASLQAHRGQIAVLSSQSVLLTGENGELTIWPDERTDAYLRTHSSLLKQMPLIANVQNGIWNGAVADKLILNPAPQVTFTADLLRMAKEKHYSGYIIDFESLSDKAVGALPVFLRNLHNRLSQAKLDLWVTVPVGPEVWPLDKMQEAGAGILFMAYDQCWDSSTPGPIAGADWLKRILPQRLRKLNRARAIVALAGYGYDWPEGGVGHSITISEAQTLARKYNARLARGEGSGNVTFRYEDNGVHHTVWFVDGYSFREARAITRKLGIRRLALWRLGSEDPVVWDEKAAVARLPSVKAPPSCDPLDEVH